MNFEPIVLTRAERLSEKPLSRWRRLRHYGPQVMALGTTASARWVRLLPRRTARIFWSHWVLSLMILAGALTGGGVYWVEIESRSEKAAKQATVGMNQRAALKYAEDWKAAFLGDRQAICFESWSPETLVYTVACHIGAKGTDPKKVLECHEYGCEYKDL